MTDLLHRQEVQEERVGDSWSCEMDVFLLEFEKGFGVPLKRGVTEHRNAFNF